MKEKTKGDGIMVCRNCDIFMARLSEDADGGSLQAGVRPVLIVSNDKANQYSGVVTILPITSKRKRALPTHVLLKGCGVVRQSIILAEQITSINKSQLIRYMGSIKKTEYEERVKQAIEIQLNL